MIMLAAAATATKFYSSPTSILHSGIYVIITDNNNYTREHMV